MPRLIYQRYKQLYSRKQKDEKQESPTHHFQTWRVPAAQEGVRQPVPTASVLAMKNGTE